MREGEEGGGGVARQNKQTVQEGREGGAQGHLEVRVALSHRDGVKHEEVVERRLNHTPVRVVEAGQHEMCQGHCLQPGGPGASPSGTSAAGCHVSMPGKPSNLHWR